MIHESALNELGWSPRWEALFEPHVVVGLMPGRVVRTDRGSLLLAMADGVVRAKGAVRLMKGAKGPRDLPVVGDWVGVRVSREMEFPVVEVVLERTGVIVRGDPGKRSQAQMLAANVDTVFVVHPIAQSPNLRRIERELALAWDSEAIPVVVLTKADLSGDPDEALGAVEAIAPGVDVLLVNALDGESAGQLVSYISDHRTGVLLGPSGAGKSTLINALLGEERQATREVRVGDGRGRHTTVARELIRIAHDGLIIDTPGLRALGLTGSVDGISAAFPDIEELSDSCHFRDCSHLDEPGCAVRSAVESGALPAQRLASYHKLLREAHVAATKTNARLRSQEKRKSKMISKAARQYFKRKDRG